MNKIDLELIKTMIEKGMKQVHDIHRKNALFLIRRLESIAERINNIESKLKESVMPIPGDNGHPKEERDAQNQRIKDVANNDAKVHQELKLNKPEPKEKTIMGDI